MLVNNIFKVVLLLLSAAFIALEGLEYQLEAAAVSSFILILLTVFYSRWTEKKSIYFIGFLVTFTIAHALSYMSWYTPVVGSGQTDYIYYLVNILYILAYVFLITRCLIELSFKEIFTQLPVPIVILVILDVFCVILVTDTAQNALNFYEYTLEFFYNTVIMTLLSVAVINYLYRNDNKSMLLLIGSICIVFSEVIQLAYYYILQDNNLGLIYSFFLVIAFLFFYLQSQLVFTGPEPAFTDEEYNNA
ncbi:MAG: hypothetical protein HKN40_03260 [Winogradskyella sp.]|uniref:hypothetical protein n=1 Tax=Winogradskyella sp. TaxID=1883156 RepID=UPI0017E5D2E1|nr:hypothetical protein [Winogradskyella sp.]